MPRVICSDGLCVHYEVRGESGPWVVLIQGLGLSSEFWVEVTDHVLGHDSGPYRLLLVDNRGTSRCDPPKRPFTITRMADDAAETMRHAGVDRAIVVGISMGGMIAQELAIRHPDLMSGLVLLATTPGLPHGRMAGPRALAMLASLPFALHTSARRRVMRSLLFANPPTEQTDAALEKLISQWEPLMIAARMKPREYFLQLAAAATHSAGSRLHRISCPTIVVTGASDILIPPRNSEILASRIPDARLEVLPGVGHVIPAENPHIIPEAIARLAGRPA